MDISWTAEASKDSTFSLLYIRVWRREGLKRGRWKQLGYSSCRGTWNERGQRSRGEEWREATYIWKKLQGEERKRPGPRALGHPANLLRLAEPVSSSKSLLTGFFKNPLQQDQNLPHIESPLVQCLLIPYQSCICRWRPADHSMQSLLWHHITEFNTMKCLTDCIIPILYQYVRSWINLSNVHTPM